MNQKPLVLAIIPAFKEEKNIGPVISCLRKKNLDVLVIDDCSPDKTGNVARNAGAKVLRMPMNLGYAVALQTGYLYARDNNYSAVLQLDGDGQHDPESAEDLLAPILCHEADIAIGSRFLGECSYTVPWVRRWGQRLFGGIAGLLTGKPVTDPTSGYQALSAEVFRFYCCPLFPDDYPDADMWILLHRMGFRVKEIPVKMHGSSGQSMHGGILRPMYYIYKMTVAIFTAFFRPLPSREGL